METATTQNGKIVYALQSRENGWEIERFETLEEAEKSLEENEKDDRANGDYVPDFYEIVDVIED